MTERGKRWLGIATFSPLLYLTLMVLAMPWISDRKEALGLVSPSGEPSWWAVAHLALHAMTILLGVSVTLTYLVFVFRGGVPRNRRSLWASLLIFGSIVSIVPFYWLYVRTDQEVAHAA